jgi:hypothetical protein
MKTESFAFGKDSYVHGKVNIPQMINPKSVELHLELLSENCFERLVRKIERISNAVSKRVRSKFKQKERDDEGALEENI